MIRHSSQVANLKVWYNRLVILQWMEWNQFTAFCNQTMYHQITIKWMINPRFEIHANQRGVFWLTFQQASPSFKTDGITPSLQKKEPAIISIPRKPMLYSAMVTLHLDCGFCVHWTAEGLNTNWAIMRWIPAAATPPVLVRAICYQIAAAKQPVKIAPVRWMGEKMMIGFAVENKGKNHAKIWSGSAQDVIDAWCDDGDDGDVVWKFVRSRWWK